MLHSLLRHSERLIQPRNQRLRGGDVTAGGGVDEMANSPVNLLRLGDQCLGDNGASAETLQPSHGTVRCDRERGGARYPCQLGFPRPLLLRSSRTKPPHGFDGETWIHRQPLRRSQLRGQRLHARDRRLCIL